MPLNPLIPSLPGRSENCPAAPICAFVGNDRKGCYAGSPDLGLSTSEKCMAGLILLLARGQGLYTQEMEVQLQERRKIGFAPPSENADL